MTATHSSQPSPLRRSFRAEVLEKHVANPCGFEPASEDCARYGHVRTEMGSGDPLRPRTLGQRFPLPRRRENDQKHEETPKTYLIGAEGSPLVKIGMAKNPEARVKFLQTGQPMLLSLLWTHEDDHERTLHRRFADQRIRGEWFDLTPLGDPVEVVTAAIEEIEAAEQ